MSAGLSASRVCFFFSVGFGGPPDPAGRQRVETAGRGRKQRGSVRSTRALHALCQTSSSSGSIHGLRHSPRSTSKVN